MDKFFTEEDQAKFIKFLNMVARHAKFEVTTPELIEYYKLLSHMQTTMIPKLEANILEVKRVIESQQKQE